MKTKDIKGKIRAYFFLHPTIKLRVRHIEREVKVPLPSVIRYTKELERESILKHTEIAGIIAYSAERTSPQFLLQKKLFNLQQLFASGIVDFFVQELSNPTVILFGSYSRGEDTEESDIDIYIETPLTKHLKIEKFEKFLQRKIQIFTYKNIHAIENKDLANNIINGITLNGFMEIFTNSQRNFK